MSRPGVHAQARLASIHIYPMKAGRAVGLAESVVEPWGLAGDRGGSRFRGGSGQPQLPRSATTAGSATITGEPSA